MSSLPNQPTADAGPDHIAAARVERLYASHSALVRSVCRSLLRNREDADDAVQQTFLSAHRALLNGSCPRDAAAWLATIARHESFARVRARMREPLPIDTEAEAAGPDAHAAAVRRHEVGELRDALAELPAQQREALLLREVRGFSYEEVGSTLSVTTSAVESLLFRARRTLQVQLRDALAAFSPGGLVRELAARLGGGFVAPAAAKAIAVGAGAAVVTAGGVVGPQIIGLGHAPHTRPSASARRGGQDGRARVTLDATSWSSRARIGGTPYAGDAPTRHETGDHSSGGDVASSRVGSDGGADSSTSSDSGSSGSNDSAGTTSGDTQATSSGSDGTTTDSSSQTTESQSTTETTTTSSGSDGSGGTTTTSGLDGG